MSNLHGIDEVISRIWEDLPIFAKEIVLDGYLEIYNGMCIVCCGDVTDNKCADAACAGPASKTREETCEEAFHAMHDNLSDMDFDDASSLLSSFIEVWEAARADKYPSKIEIMKELALKPYRHAACLELTKIKDIYPEIFHGVDFSRLAEDLGYTRNLLGRLLTLPHDFENGFWGGE